METLANSRFITYPSIVEKSINHTVGLIDADDQTINAIGTFLQASQSNFDVYLYQGDLHDLEWLNYISNNTDVYLINNTSQVKISQNSIRYGVDQELTNPLDYFRKIEQLAVDNNVESIV